jgi:hypothetical protein
MRQSLSNTGAGAEADARIIGHTDIRITHIGRITRIIPIPLTDNLK